MTIAQQFKEEGRKEGREEILRLLLAERKDLSEENLVVWVSGLSGISIEKVRELYNKQYREIITLRLLADRNDLNDEDLVAWVSHLIDLPIEKVQELYKKNWFFFRNNYQLL